MNCTRRTQEKICILPTRRLETLSEKQKRIKWIIGLAMGVMMLIAAPMISFGNGPELLPPGWKFTFVEEYRLKLKPAWATSHGIRFETLRINLYKISQAHNRCVGRTTFAYFMSSHLIISEDDLKAFPLKLSLAKAAGSPPKDQNDKIPRGRGIIDAPDTESSIEVRVEEAGQKDFEDFAEKVTEEERETLRRGISKDQSGIGICMENPQDPGTYIWVEIINPAFIPLR